MIRCVQPPAPVDGCGRSVGYLRLSVTDRCNLRCRYCMPAEGPPPGSRAELLDDDQLLLVARAAAAVGLRKIRITGGEPLVRPGLCALLARIAALPGVRELALTTNGVLLAGRAVALRAAGVGTVNVSIDSLQPERYAAITRGGRLADCRAGIDAALAAGCRVRLNMVVMRGVNDGEIGDLADLARRLPLTVRFIETMPTLGPSDLGRLLVPAAEILAALPDAAALRPLPRGELAGPSRDFAWPDSPGAVGVISAVSDHFCAGCNRLRVTAAGAVRSCLFHDAGQDLRPLLVAGDLAGTAAALRRAIARKPAGHRLGELAPAPVRMSGLGG